MIHTPDRTDEPKRGIAKRTSRNHGSAAARRRREYARVNAVADPLDSFLGNTDFSMQIAFEL
jgi:hypothetical protein